MKKLNELMVMLYVAVATKLTEFKEREEGDTNFVSMLLIIGIVVVLAGLFLTLGRGVVTRISQKVTQFISSLG